MISKTFLPFLLCAVAAGSAHAEPLTSPMQATASVIPSCSLVQNRFASTLKYDPVGANATQKVMGASATSTRFEVRCNRQSGIKVLVGQGLHASAGSTCETPLRNMQNANGDRLAYRLNHSLTDNGTYSLGCGANNARALDFSTSNVASFLAIVVIDPGQSAAAGSYSDTLVATVIF